MLAFSLHLPTLWMADADFEFIEDRTATPFIYAQVLFTVMATPEDLRANAEYIRMADSFVEVPGGANNNNYANVRLIVETAESVGADAVWAGWGHASENPALPNSLLATPRQILFIGPPAGPMHALGDKIGSTIIAQSAGVPCISWNGQNIRCNYATEGLPSEIYAQADVRTVEEAQKAAEQVGYPLMIKASEGGGGKGIRKVMDGSTLVQSYRQVQGEVPGSPIFLMKLAPRSRHLEVQLLADQYGNAIALFGRDCSVQRRHQKIMEEGPVLAAPADTWSQMEKAAVKLAKEVGYVNAGTVEYLWLEDDGSFAFLELNPRLQVEHPVTEMITGVNLPAAQLQVAMGIPLYAIPDVRKLYGRGDIYVDGSQTGPGLVIDFDTEERVKPQGHVIAARITAENPDSGFQPTGGAISELNFRSTPDVWGYFSVDSSGRVHEFADSQIGHLFSWGASRDEARQHMVLAMKELSIRGDIRTTVEYLVHMMESADFRANRINTSWLDARISAKITASKPDALLVAMMGAVWRAHTANERRRVDYIGCLERGQYPPPALLSVNDDIELIHDNVKYSLHATLSGPSTITLMCNGTWVQADFRPLADGGLLVSLGKTSHVIYAKEEPSGLRLVLDGATCMFTNEYDPTQLRAAMSGKLARYLVEDGASVKVGSAYAEVEVMKMYMSLTVPEGGKVRWVKPEGSVLEPGDLIARVDLDDPSKVLRAEPFMGVLPAAESIGDGSSTPSAGDSSSLSGAAALPALEDGVVVPFDRYSRRWHIVARNALRILGAVLAGYVIPRDVYDSAWFDRDAAFAAPDLALLEVEEVMSVLASRLPSKLTAAITAAIDAHKEAAAVAAAAAAASSSTAEDATVPAAVAAAPPSAGSAKPTVAVPPSSTPRGTSSPSASVPELDVAVIDKLITDHAATLAPRDVVAFTTTSQPLRDVCDRFKNGVAGAGRASLVSLVQQYLAVERTYSDGRRPEDIIADLRSAAGTDKEKLTKVYETARAHSHLKQRNILVLSALSRITEDLEIHKNAKQQAAAAALAAGTASATGVGAADALSPSRGVAKAKGQAMMMVQGSFMSVSSRSMGSMNDLANAVGADGGASEGGRLSSSPAADGGDDMDGDTLDIIQPTPVGSTLATSGALATSMVHGRAPSTAYVHPSDVKSVLPQLHQLAELRGIEYSEVTLEARQMLVVQQLPSQRQRRTAVEGLLRAMGTPSAIPGNQSVREDAMAGLIDDDQPLLDVLMSYFGHADPLLRHNAAEVYVRRLYRLYNIRSIDVAEQDGHLVVTWTFTSEDATSHDLSRPSTRSGSVDAVEAEALLPSSSHPISGMRRGLPAAESYVDLSQVPGHHHPLRIANPVKADVLALNQNDVPPATVPRTGVMAAFPSLAGFRSGFPVLLARLARKAVSQLAPMDGSAAPTAEEVADLSRAAVHVLHVSLLRSPAADPEFTGLDAAAAKLPSAYRSRVGSSAASGGGGVASIADALAEDEQLEKRVVEVLTTSLSPYHKAMLQAGLRRITFNVPHPRDSGDLTRSKASHTPFHDAATAFVASISVASASNGSVTGGLSSAESSVITPTGRPPLRKMRSSAMLGSPAGGAGADRSTSRTGPTATTRQAGVVSSLLGGFPWIYTFRAVVGYAEDSIVRHIEPPSSANLELKRLANFKVRLVPTPNPIVHVYAAQPREEAVASAKPAAAAGGDGEGGAGGRGSTRMRYFVRAIVRQTARIPTLDSVYEQYPGPERMFVECLDALNLAMGDALADTTLPVGNNHIFLNVLPVANVAPEYIETVVKILAKRYADRLRRLRVSQVEFKINVQATPTSHVIPIRLVSSNPTGYVLRVDTYVEARDEMTGQPIFTSIAPAAIGTSSGWVLSSSSSSVPDTPAVGTSGFLAGLGLSSIGGLGASTSSSAGLPSASARGELDGKPVTTPYPVVSPFERQRALAAALTDTIYVYDFIELFTRALEIEWSRYEKQRGLAMPVRKPRSVLSAVELVMRPKASAPKAGADVVNAGDGSASAGLRRNHSIYIDQFSNEASIAARGLASNDTAPSSPAPSRTMTSASSSSSMAASPYPGSAGRAGSSSRTSGAAGAAAAGSSILSTDGEYELVEAVRPPGSNDIGMVAWRVTMYTPQYGEESGGREVVIIANDITFRAGSFGTAEDRLFNLASTYARTSGIPRVYLAANSGARIGLAEEVKKLFRVAWNDAAQPDKGYKYLYLSPDDYHKLCSAGTAGSVTAGGAVSSASSSSIPPVLTKPIVEGGEERYVITDIIGRETDLGVENLRGSGTIAGETSRAYAESFTLTYVTGRTVGIGAYLVRLGQRCIQKLTGAPIILTGFEALNKLMGSEVYSSNQQLGGPKIMHTNGVTHDTVNNDFEGVLSVLRWLSYVPRVKGAPLPVTDVTRGDEVDRDIEFEPPTTAFDPRQLLTGTMPEPLPTATPSPSPNAAAAAAAAASQSKWVSGLFDRDSWHETMGGWAKSVVTGRARLGGIPVGIIMPELRTSTAIAPADPASPASKENVVAQAGQVWYPDSAFKTAQAIRDFTGEDLPIMILANWRGFSGGQRDMFLEVLKYGSYIVDALVACKQPVFVYIPPGGELRGGAWVVVDPTINPDVMEMYADVGGRGGVLEPAGTAAIKFRTRELMATAHRLDPALADLDKRLKAAAAPGSATASETSSIKAAIRSREESLSGIYLQVAHTFADLHDTPGRMQAKGTINGVVPWRRARAFFYWRLRRKLAENSLVQRLIAAAPQMGFGHATTLLKSWYFQALAAEGHTRIAGEVAEAAFWKDDVRVLRWLADHRDTIEARAMALRKESVAEQVLSLGLEDASAVVTGVLALVSRLPLDRREAVLGQLRRGVIFSSSSLYQGHAAGPMSPGEPQYF